MTETIKLIIVRIRLYLSWTLLILFSIMLNACLEFRMSKKEINKYFSQRGIPFTMKEPNPKDSILNSIHVGDTKKKLVVFVHGSPGSSTDFISLLTDTLLLNQVQMLSIDRPGFGYSKFGKAEPSLHHQARRLKQVCDSFRNNKPLVLVGHSLGAPVVCQMSIDYPYIADYLILVSGSLDPDLEPKEGWFRTPLALPPLRWIMPRSLRASNDEIRKLKYQLQQLEPDLSLITCPVYIIQGLNDRFVPYQNVDYIKQKIQAHVTVQLVNHMDHFVPWSHPHLIREAILKRP